MTLKCISTVDNSENVYSVSVTSLCVNFYLFFVEDILMIFYPSQILYSPRFSIFNMVALWIFCLVV